MLIRYSRDALKFLQKLNKKSVERIRIAITGLTRQPPVGDIKAMQGSLDARLRLCVGSWRIIFKYGTERRNPNFIYLRNWKSWGYL